MVELPGKMERIWVIGCPGSGKTTLGTELAGRIGVRFVELDALHHRAGWQPTPVTEFRAELAALLADEHWVVDGNYLPVQDIVQSNMDTVVWLDLARWRVMSRIIRRSLRRVLRRTELWNGNRESWRKLLSADPERNVIVWAWQHHPKYRARYSTRAVDGTWSSANLHRLRSPREVRSFLAKIPEICP